MKRNIALGFVVAGVVALAVTRAGGEDADAKVRLLEAENHLLRSQVEALKKELAAIKAQMSPSPASSQPSTAQAPSPTESPKTETIMYLGKPRPKLWVDYMYKQFADKIVIVNGKYIDVGKAMAGASEVPAVAEIGAAGETPGWCQVMQIIGKDEALIRRPAFHSQVTGTGGGAGGYAAGIQAALLSKPELIFHVKGIGTKGLVDGAEFRAKLVCIGTYNYGNVAGGGSTIPSYAVHTPLTREQFTEAIAGSFQLVSYRAVKQKKPGGEMEIKAVGTPVP